MRQIRQSSYFVAMVVVAASTVAVGSAASTAATPTKSPPNYQTSITASKSVRTSTGVRVSVKVFIADGMDQLAPDVSPKARATRDGRMRIELTSHGESHTWTIPVPGSGVALDKSGRGRVRIAKAKLGKFGRVGLKVVPRGHWKMHACHADPFWRHRPARIHGVFHFNTRSGKHGWGSLGSGHFSFSAGSQVEQMTNPAGIYMCDYYTYPPCHATYGWTTHARHHFRVTGLTGKNPRLMATRTHRIARPEGTVREDELVAPLRSAVVTRKGATPRLTLVGNGHRTRGRATLTATSATPKQVTEQCSPGNGNVAEQQWHVRLHNGDHHLHAKQIFGDLTFKNGTGGSLTRYAPLVS